MIRGAVIPLHEWQTFFSVQASAAATLTGLVFVAVSINLARVLETPGLSRRAAESLQHFLQVFFICTFAFIPGQSIRTLAFEILVIALLIYLLQSIGHIRHAITRKGDPWTWLGSRVVQTHFAAIPFIVGAILILLGNPAGMYWLVPGFIFSFLAGIANAWILLIEIVR